MDPRTDDMTFVQKILGKKVFGCRAKNAKKSTQIRKQGNKLYAKLDHDCETHSQILSLYTESAALAENGSEELALAYSNRSALLLHLSKYEECLIDVDRAQRITQSEELKAKLVDRKVKCLSSEKGRNLKDKKSSRNSSKPSLRPSKAIPCASELVSLVSDDRYGRHVVATRDIDPGTIIALEKGFATIAKKSQAYLNCSHCLKMAWNAIPCDSCTCIVFCSEKCKRDAWSLYHDVECLLFSHYDLFNYEKAINVVLSLRIFIRAIREEGLKNIIEDTQVRDSSIFEDGTFLSSKFKSVYNLSNQRDGFFDPEEEFVSFVADFLFENSSVIKYDCAIDKDTQSCIRRILLDLFNIVNQNSYTFQYSGYYSPPSSEVKMQDDEDSIGIIITLFCSLFNHSCCNNVQRLFTPEQEIMLFTTQTVKKGEQLFVNYGQDLYKDKLDRQLYLKENYKFVCACQACKDNWDSDPDITKHLNEGLVTELFSAIHNMACHESVFSIFCGPLEDISYTEDVFNDVIKIIKLIYKRCNGFEAHVNSFLCQIYVTKFFDIHYGVKNEVPKIC